MRLTMCLRRRAAQLLDYYSQFHPSVLSIQQFLDFGAATGSSSEPHASERKSYLFLRKELLVRLANIMKEINLLPEQLLSMPSVQMVESWYEQSFQDIMQYDKENPNDRQVMESFTETITHVRNRHSKVVETMAQGVIEMKETHPDDNVNLENQMQYFLDRFYMSRISIRMLINQHTLLFSDTIHNHPLNIGCIDPFCDVTSVAVDAYENARFLCEQYYMACPDIEYVVLNTAEAAEKVGINYVPSHLYHMLFELLKNAMRAVIEHHEEDSTLPPIKMMICKGKEDLTIKLMDQGGGIPRIKVDMLFNYMYSTAPRPPSPSAASSTPLAGYGYGLPLSRLYAKYFNGDLNLSSVEGYGTDAIIHLKVFPSEANELLPIYNRTSLQRYSSSVPVGDWSDSSQTTGLHGAVHQVGQNRNYTNYTTHQKNADAANDKKAKNSTTTTTSSSNGKNQPSSYGKTYNSMSISKQFSTLAKYTSYDDEIKMVVGSRLFSTSARSSVRNMPTSRAIDLKTLWTQINRSSMS